MSTDTNCLFCNVIDPQVLDQSDTCFAMRDGFPVTTGHTLIITKRHVETYFDLTPEERADVQRHIDLERQRLMEDDKTISGFNIGMNCGEDAGQSIMHCHVHLIPRRKGDIENPRGGVRGVIPDKRIY
jgi:ATP adenylyltransferase